MEDDARIVYEFPNKNTLKFGQPENRVDEVIIVLLKLL